RRPPRSTRRGESDDQECRRVVRRANRTSCRCPAASSLKTRPSGAPRDEGLPNTYGARGRIALSGGGLRPPGPVGGLHFGSWRERAEPRDAAARSQERRGDDEPHSKALLIPVPALAGVNSSGNPELEAASPQPLTRRSVFRYSITNSQSGRSATEDRPCKSCGCC